MFFPVPFARFLSFCCSDWPFSGLACVGKTIKKESSSGPIFSMEQLGVVAGNFALGFSLIFFSIFVHISIRPIAMI